MIPILLAILLLTQSSLGIQVHRPPGDAVVHKGAPPGTPVVQLSAVDPKKNKKVSFRLHKGLDYQFFDIDEHSGQVVTKLPIQKGVNDTYRLIAVAYIEGESMFERVNVLVIPINQHEPVFAKDSYTFFLNSSAPEGGVLGDISATDADVDPHNSNIVYSLKTDGLDSEIASSIAINETTGEIYARKKLPLKARGSYNFTALAVDSGSPRKTALVPVNFRAILPPTDIVATNMTSSSLMVCWTIPRNGILAGYTVELKTSEETKKSKYFLSELFMPDGTPNKPVENSKFASDQQRLCAKINNVASNTYHVSVEAWSNTGDDGMKSHSIEVSMNACFQTLVCNAGRCLLSKESEIGFMCQCEDGFYGDFCEFVDPCENNPCLNFASCEDLGSGAFECLCPEGFRGELCETADPCMTIEETCFNGGTCLSSSGVATCICASGYYGDKCETPDPCFQNPCLAGGTCARNGAKSTCLCKPGYVGAFCEQVDLCWNITCQNGGQCSSVTGRALCACKDGYMGEDCSDFDPCTTKPCLNHGACTRLSNIDFSCTCAPGFLGNTCKARDPCFLFPCMNGGTCIARGNVPFCVCERGFIGGGCETKDFCFNNPCRNGATCLTQSATCTCAPGFLGRTCEVEDHCHNFVCQNEGTCVVEGNEPKCACKAGFVGQACEKKDFCYNDPCKNGATCSTESESCTCAPGFRGALCKRKDLCYGITCSNDGTCLESNGEAKCLCQEGYIGKGCELRDPCIPSPCRNNGTCQLRNNTFHCECPRGYMGDTCDSIDLCFYEPCGVHGICEQNGETFACTCHDGWHGQFCEEVNPCHGNPCANGGTCAHTKSAPGFICGCPVGFLGIRCESVNHCFGNPCNNGGTCAIEGDTFSCTCVSGFEGDTCVSWNACHDSPCVNGGTCETTNGTFLCTCPDGLEGTTCEILNPCHRNPCKNDGHCQRLKVEPGWLCECLDRFEGPACDVVKPCHENPCANGGTCSAKNGTFLCSCTDGFEGITCEVANPCHNNPCANGGTCLAGNGTFICSCATGFEGNTCEVENPCHESPCANGGTCLAKNGTFLCSCTDGFEGITCEVVNPCHKNPCANEGTCLAENGTFFCFCADEFEGTTCEMTNPCHSDPCQNGGFCQRIEEEPNFLCECLEGFEGPTCQVLNPCQRNPCANNGTCESVDNKFNCTCSDGFEGSTCEKVDPCHTNPCQNGGLCQRTEVQPRYFCECLGGFEGESCQVVNQCYSSPCRNNGTCESISGTFQCACADGFEGSTCEEVDPCHKNPCQNGGLCQRTEVQPRYFCECLDGFEGDSCQVVNQCYSSPCRNSGTCESKSGTFQCACADGFEGATCDEVDPCYVNPCQNGGLCQRVEEESGWLCVCLDKYRGKTCDIEDPCYIDPCSNGGTCRSENGALACSCRNGFTGAKCEEVDLCHEHRCANNSTCSSDGVTFMCTCHEDYYGDLCDTYNYCSQKECQNGGTCKNMETGFLCTCPDGFSGELCEVRDPCFNHLCLNGISSVKDNSTCTCECQEGYIGDFCELQDLCAQNPCMNLATCSGTREGYTCLCPDDFAGKNCDIKVNLCDSDPCLNGGTCESFTVGEITCLCTEYHTGSLCETQVVHICESEPCENGGLCTVISPGERICDCLEGYEGVKCETKTNFCDSNPCERGNCETLENGYRCDCDEGFTGVRCESVIDFCESQPCRNGGSCNSEPSGFHCECTEGFKGNHCEVVTNPCIEISPSPCENGGTCVPSNRSFVCECPDGFSGKSCELLETCPGDVADLATGYFQWSSVEFGETSRILCPNGPIALQELRLPTNITSWNALQAMRSTRMVFPATNSTSFSKSKSPSDRKSLIVGKTNDPVKDRMGFSWAELEKTTARTLLTSKKKITIHKEKREIRSIVKEEMGEKIILKRDRRDRKKIEREIESHAMNKDAEYRSHLDSTSAWSDAQRAAKENSLKLGDDGRAYAVRSCVLDKELGKAVWMPVDDSFCKTNFTESIRGPKRLLDDFEVAGRRLSGLLGNPAEMTSQQFRDAANQIEKLVSSAVRSPLVANSMLSYVSQMLEADDAVMEQASDSAASVLRSLEKLSKNAIVYPGSSFAFQTKNLVMETKVLAKNSSQPENATFSPAFATRTNNPGGPETKLVIPDELVKHFLQDEGSARLQFMSFRTGKLFRSVQNGTVQKTATHVLSASVGNATISNLRNPVRYYIPVDRPLDHFCAYWDEDEKIWSTQGLTTKYEGSVVVCESTHLTSFSVFFDPYAGMARLRLSEEHRRALSVISYMGSALSMLGLTITVITYVLFRVLRRDRSGKILLNLSISLLCLNLVFLLNSALDIPLNVDDESDEVFLFQQRMQSNSADAILCVALAIMMHYFVLTSLAWMLVEAAHMYHLLITVFAGTETHFMLKRALAAWGIPAVLVSIVAGISLDFYRDSTSATCRISPEHPGVFFGAFIVPAVLIIFTNCVVFLMVVRVIMIQGRRQAAATKFGTPDKPLTFNGVTTAQIRGGITVMALVGATWITGPLAVGVLRIPMQYLFCLTNTLQGFVIFLVRVVLFPDARNSWLTLFHTGKISKTRRDISSNSYITNSHSQVRNTQSTSTNLLHSSASNASSIVRLRSNHDEFSGLTRDSPTHLRKPARILPMNLKKNADNVALRHEEFCPSVNPSARVFTSKNSKNFTEEKCICTGHAPGTPPRKEPKKPNRLNSMYEGTVDLGLGPVKTPLPHFEASRTFPRPGSGLTCPEISDKTFTIPRTGSLDPELRILTGTGDTLALDESAENSWLFLKPEATLPGIEESPHSLEHIDQIGDDWNIGHRVPKSQSILELSDASDPVLRDCSSEMNLPRVVDLLPKNKIRNLKIDQNRNLARTSNELLTSSGSSSPCVNLSGHSILFKDSGALQLPLLRSDSLKTDSYG